MKTLITIILTTFCLLTTSFRQTSNSFTFSMKAPEKWNEITNEDIWNNIDKFKLTDSELNKYISDHKGSVLLLAYLKYKQTEHPGLIPTIQVNLRINTTNNFKDFFLLMSKSAEDMKKHLNDYEFIDNPDTLLVGGKKAMFFSAKFTMSTKNGAIINARSRTYAVPNGDKFFQINFTDGDGEDCSKLYDELLKTIEF